MGRTRRLIFLTVALSSLASVAVLTIKAFVGRRAEDSPKPRFTVEKREEGLTLAIIDGGVPPDLDRQRYRIVGVHDFTGEGFEDAYGHGTFVQEIIDHFSGEPVDRAIEELMKREKTLIPVQPRSEPSRKVNVIYLKVIDRMGKTTPVRILEAAEVAARENVDVAAMALNVWLPPAESDIYFDRFAEVARGSRSIWVVGYPPNDSETHRPRGDIPFPGHTQYVIRVGSEKAKTASGPRSVNDPKPLFDLATEILPEVRKVAANHAFGRANDLFARGQYDEAITWYLESVSLDQSRRDAWINLGAAWRLTDDREAASAAWQIALQVDPLAKEAYYNLANLQHENHEESRAVELLHKALSAVPGFSEARSLLGTILTDLGQLKEAIDHCKQAANEEPKNPKFQQNLARAYLKAGLWKQSIPVSERAAELDPNYPLAFLSLGIAHLYMKQHSQAIQNLRKSIQLKDDLPEAHWYLSLALLASGSTQEATSHYQKALGLRSSFAREDHPLRTQPAP